MNFGIDKKLSREILHIAIPTIAGLSSQMVVSIVNTGFVGRLENAEIQLAAMGLGFLGSWAITSLFSSLSTGTHVLVARRHGEENAVEVGEVLNNSLVICFILGVLFGTIGYLFSYNIIDFFSKDDAVTRAGALYMKYQFIGLPFFLLIVSYRGFFYGIGHTKIFMYSALIINLFNILFNYLFIFGAFGFPKMELAGAGIGSSISMFLGWLFFLCVTFVKDYRKQYKYFSHFRLSKDVIAQIVRISIPVSLQNILILLGFLVFVAITGIIGTTAQAASQVVISALFISLMPCFGFGVAAQTLVGQSIGKGEVRLAQLYGFETAKLGTIFTILVGFIFVLFPDVVLIVITTNAEVIHAARPVLQVAGIAQIFYASGIILASALQAGGATVYVMFVEVLTHWVIFLPLTYIFGVTFRGGLQGAWLALPIYIVAYSVMNYMKFRSSSWLQIKL
ncbi:MAG: MATE family efflux transporter [Ignavibacteriae bacterium]|nr:MATE family efflux transporter [Ignavibacteria bacterium]MBI3363471.1 MATE family efflux transporter [Ignavibacteriota bacterium]